MPSLMALVLAAQAPLPLPARPALPSGETVAVATAVRAEVPPVIDGRDWDAVWALATPITDFRQWQPTEDAPPRYRTEARVAYDSRHIYVFVRAYDPHPDSILRILARRDTWTAADKIWVMIDSYHDRRSGYEFGVNPAGVKFDMAISNDGNEDDVWDAVWDVATTVDSLGWTAEYRIPLSQLRYPPGEQHTFGFAVWRDLQRYSERESWPVFRRSRPGMPSQFGVLQGLTGLASPRRLEITPYGVARNAPATVPGGGFERDQTLTAGADIKYGLTSNLTLDATVNPDFGQVEADPAVLNLSAFETFFSERRPFFVEGAGLFSFEVNCNVVNCSGENLFYSRRIGRSPQLGFLYGEPNSATSSRILGAGKVTGRLPGGLSLAAVDAVTQRVAGRGDTTIEPTTNYFAARLQQDFRRGESGIGGMITMVHRDLDESSSPWLRRAAWVGALDFRHRFLAGRYRVSGSLDFSSVSGSRQAIARTQSSPVHFLQRPDAGTDFDTTRTSLRGSAQEIQLGKVGGRVLRWQTSYQRHSAGFEVNDLGFMQRTDQQSWATWAQLRTARASRLQRQLFWNFNWWQLWNTDGLPRERAFNTNAHIQLQNRIWVHYGGTAGQFGATYCDFDCTRGGPAVRQDPYIAPWFGFEGDGRRAIVPWLFFNFFRGSEGRATRHNVNGGANIRLSSRLTPSLGFNFTRRTTDNQSRGSLDSLGATHYRFAHLVQTEASLSVRFDYTLTPTMSVQAYGAPFVSKGTYSNVRELSATPRAAAYDDRYQPWVDPAYDPGGFNFRSFNSNVVFRWEYRPGSTLFFVWQQGRSDFAGLEGGRSIGGDLSGIMDLRPNNVFLVKASYWLSW
jgi:hypothetical protein